MIFPAKLNKGDKIAIVSPSSAEKPEFVAGAVEMLKQWGLVPIVAPHCLGSAGTYSATADHRLADLKEAFLNPDVKAILSARGGYGMVHLVESLTADVVAAHPKWVIGFSDISALHAVMQHNGIASIHASMAKHLANYPENEECNATLKAILMEGNHPIYTVKPHEFNHCGAATGTLLGGNLTVLTALLGSPYNILKPDSILFIEDIGEEVYRVERMLYSLRYAGVLQNVRALVVGQFTDYHNPDRNGDSMEQMIHRLVDGYDFPIAFNFPVGHVSRNLPLIEGATATLSVTPQQVTLSL